MVEEKRKGGPEWMGEKVGSKLFDGETSRKYCYTYNTYGNLKKNYGWPEQLSTWLINTPVHLVLVFRRNRIP